MIELPPKINVKPEDLHKIDESQSDQINVLLDQYLYWNDIKYKKIKGIEDQSQLWGLIKKLRKNKSVDIYPNFGLNFSLTNEMLKLCHIFDMTFGGSWGSESIIPQKNRQRYLISSVIEEAISSSQMEGASTTRKVAKEMLRKNITPKDKSQRMIYNNYQTINFLSSKRDAPLTEEMILKIHSLITQSTLTDEEYSGSFRTNNDVVVENAVTHEVVHTPPSYTEIPQAIEWLISFANNENEKFFIHPIIKAIIIHFFISYLHPFVDGNGRTARALFHWFMLKNGYWLTEYMSISRIISSTKISYENSFLYTEADGNDMGYFITYHLKALGKAFEALKKYISKKVAQQTDQNRLLKIGGINPRQAEILYMFLKEPEQMLTIKDITSKIIASPTTIKQDLVSLMKKELITEINLNRHKNGYVRGIKYKEIVESLY